MNNDSLANLKVELNQIRTYFTHTQHINTVIPTFDIASMTISDDLQNLLKNVQENYKNPTFRSKKSIFEYKAIIISLYGLLEKYIELWVKDFLLSLSDIVPYNLLSDKIRNKHFELSIQLISIIMEGRWDKYQHLSKETVLSNLKNCIDKPEQYEFNAEAFIIQSGNLRHQRITDIFKNLNINLGDFLIKNEALNRATGLHPNKIQQARKQVLYAKIEELVSRRNQIAHGNEVLNLLSHDVLIEYIDFLEVYLQAIFEALAEKLIGFEAKHTYQKIEVVKGVWNASILGFEIANYTIQVGDFLIVKTGKGRFFKKSILSLQQNNKPHKKLIIKEEVEVGIQVKPTINKNYTFYLKKNKILKV